MDANHPTRRILTGASTSQNGVPWPRSKPYDRVVFNPRPRQLWCSLQTLNALARRSPNAPPSLRFKFRRTPFSHTSMLATHPSIAWRASFGPIARVFTSAFRLLELAIAANCGLKGFERNQLLEGNRGEGLELALVWIRIGGLVFGFWEFFPVLEF